MLYATIGAGTKKYQVGACNEGSGGVSNRSFV
jgi:hypothetical protein